MKCPYLHNSSPRCIRMIEEGLDGEVSDFDIKHFCNGNPVNCYYYRMPPSQKNKKL